MLLSERIALTSLILTSAAGGWSVTRFQTQRMRKRFERAGLTEYRADLENAEVRYWAGGKGDGKPLLLVHGFGGDALFGWYEQAALAKDYFLVIPDLLWFGESHASVEDFTPGFQAETVRQLLEHLALDHVDVAGISYGGFVSLELVDRYPEQVDRLIIVDSPGHTYSLDDYHEMCDRLGIDSVAELVTPDRPDGVRRLMGLAYKHPPPIPAFIARDVYRNLFVKWRTEKVRLLDDLIRMADEIDATSYTIEHPTLILWGSDDELFPVPLAHRLARAIGAHATVHVIPGTNHAPNMERPHWFNARVREFLAEKPH